MKKSNTLSAEKITTIGDYISIMAAAQFSLINKDCGPVEGIMLTQIIVEFTCKILDDISPVYTFDDDQADQLLSEQLIQRIDELEWKIQNIKVNPSE